MSTLLSLLLLVDTTFRFPDTRRLKSTEQFRNKLDREQRKLKILKSKFVL